MIVSIAGAITDDQCFTFEDATLRRLVLPKHQVCRTIGTSFLAISDWEVPCD